MLHPMYFSIRAGLIVVLVCLIAILVYLQTRVRVVPEATQCVIERFGQYHQTKSAGIHFLLPFAERPVKGKACGRLIELIH